MYQSCFISDMLNINNSKNQKQLMPMIPNINTCKCQSFWRSEMLSRQASVLIWSIELSVSYVSLKSDNITYWRWVMCSPWNKIYCHSDEKYTFLVGIGLSPNWFSNWILPRIVLIGIGLLVMLIGLGFIQFAKTETKASIAYGLGLAGKFIFGPEIC